MKSLIIAVAVLILGLISTAASAQDAVYYPGSVWTSNGTLSPVEKGNVLSLTHVEQGIAFRGAELFGEATLSADTKAYDWNRRYLTGAGVRFTQSIGVGMVRASAAYVRERRYTFEKTSEGLVLAAEAWFGWGNAPRPAKVQ